ncbi:MAG: response regulator [Verrucomicrobia bacterium]|nr:response regulator [Verrucomicrobiota bacterium]
MSVPQRINGVVLVVDDNGDNRLIAGTNLDMAGYTVLEAEDGAPALEVMAANPIDLVLLDIMMPRMDGYEVCRRIRADERLCRTKVLMLTAKARTEDLIKGFESGADDYVTKPFEIDELLARVRNLVGLKQAEDELRRINADLEGEVERRAQELVRSQAQYRTIFDAAPLSIMLLDTGGCVEAVNAWHEAHPVFSTLYAAPLVGTHLADHPTAGALAAAPLIASLAEGKAFEHQTRLEGRPGQEKEGLIVRVRGVPIRDERNTLQGALVLHEDLTEEQRLRDRALEAEKLASLGTLAQGVAHNFNNLLFVVSGSLELLRSAVDSARAERPLEQARLALSRMASLTRQLAVFSRFGEQERQPVDLGQLARDIVATFDAEFRNGLRLSLDVAENLPYVLGCAAELYQALHGLVRNALEATPSNGELRVAVRREQRVQPGNAWTEATPQDWVVCEVADNGIGMNDETRRRAFEPFFTTKQTVGVGLGLSAVHGVVRSHGGTIEIASALGKGTTITLALPTQSSAGQARPAITPTDAGMRHPHTERR